MCDHSQASLREKLYSRLGDLPPRDRPISVEVLSTEERPTYVLEKLRLDLNGMEPVPAYFVRPRASQGRAPAVLYNHAHGGSYDVGKEELLTGGGALQYPPYADVLTSLGYSALCMDMWVFGERATRTELDTFKETLWRGQVLWGLMVYDSLRGLDYLASRPEVDSSRLATLGLSMGSTMAWWVSALDERVKVCIDLCCLTDFDALIDAGNVGEHGIYYYVPGLLKDFTTTRINSLVAPRAHLSLAGDLDALTPSVGLDRIDRELQQVYADAGHPENWRLLRYPVGHVETAEMRHAVTQFLKSHL